MECADLSALCPAANNKSPHSKLGHGTTGTRSPFCKDKMTGWETLVDKKIREAMEHGEFDDLSGKGEPIDLSENPYEDPEWRQAHRMLRNAGFAPAWIEERKDIEAEIDAARASLARAWLILQNARHTEHLASAGARWKKAAEDFQAQAEELNRRIRTWNLKAPNTGVHRPRIDFDREIVRITSTGASC